MTVVERLLAERPEVVQRDDTTFLESVPEDYKRNFVPTDVRTRFEPDGTIILCYDGWEFDWEEKIVSENSAGLVEMELLTDLEEGDSKIGDRMWVKLTW